MSKRSNQTRLKLTGCTPELTLTGIEAGQTVIRAGEAFAALMKSDPETKAAWERTRARLCAFGRAMRQLTSSQEYRAAKDEERRLWKELADAIRANVQWAGNELEARSFDRPRSIEDWVHLARIVEIPFETIRAGNLTAAEIFDYARAWHNRKKIEAKLAADANAATLQQPDAGTWPRRAEGPARRTRSMPQKEANLKARDYLQDHPQATARELASAIGCAVGMVPRLPAWRAVQEELAKGRKPKAPGAVALTDKLRESIGRDESPLDQLLKEQEADARADSGPAWTQYRIRNRKRP